MDTTEPRIIPRAKRLYIRGSDARRFWARVNKDGPRPSHRPDLGPCWEWLGNRKPDEPHRSGGYGKLWSNVTRKMVSAHRFAYEAIVGPIPAKLVIDHLCRNPWCVNPRHLEPVTNQVNILRGETLPARQVVRTHCPQGHAYDAANTLTDKKGSRHCRTCQRERNRQYYARKRAARRAA